MTETQNKSPATTQKKAELVAGSDIKAIIPRNMEELARVAQGVIVSGIVPDSYRGRTSEETLSKVMIGIQKSLEVGLPPLTGLSNIMIINNRPSIWGDAAVALVQSKGVVDWVRCTYEGTPGQDDYTCVYQMKRRGQDVPYEGRFSLGDARRAKLTSKAGPWMTYPTRMMMNRARAFALRDGFADCLSGLAIAEEMNDIPTISAEPVNTSFLDDVIPPQPAETPQKYTAPVIDAEPVKAETAVCAECKGKGSIKWQAGNDSGLEPCNACKGTGKITASPNQTTSEQN